MSVWLIGAGPMAQEYVKVLDNMDVEYLIVGRSSDSANELRAKTRTKAQLVEGGYKSFLDNNPSRVEYAIICLPVQYLAECAIRLLEYGIRNILLEKPAGNSAEDVQLLSTLSNKYSANVFVAYNRRFYSSVYKAKQIIEQDGGLTSCHFEFTEWWHKIKDLDKPEEVFDKWLIGNSSHVIDMAFHMIGKPKEISCYSAGSVEHHNKSAIFAGAGVSCKNILFSYIADWKAPGRWSLELMTQSHRIILKPLEEVKVIKLGSIKEENIAIEDDLDKKYKPGLYKQTEAFFNLDRDILCSIEEQVNNIMTYYKIANY